MKAVLSIIFVTLFSASSTAFADDEFVCANNGEKRIIKIAYQDSEQSVPCEVRYDKGQGEEVLWSAQSEVGYCEAKVDEFIQKQETWGWSCEKTQQPIADVTLEDLHTSLY